MTRAFAWRRWLRPKHLAGKLGALSVGFFLLLAGLYCVAWYNAARRLEAVRQRADALGWPQTLEEWLGPEIPDAENALVEYDRATTLGFDMFGKLDEAHPEAVTFLLRGGRRADYLETLANIVRATPQFEAAVDSADKLANARSTFAYKPKIWASFHGWQDRRYIFLAELAVSRELEDAGRYAEAVRRMDRILRSTRRWIDKDPFMLSPICARHIDYGCLRELARQLELHRFPPEVHDEIDRTLQSFENIHDAYARAIHSDKFLIDECERRFGASERRPHLSARVYFDLAYVNESLQQAAECHRRPLRDAAPTYAELTEQSLRRRKWPFNLGANAYIDSWMQSAAQYRYCADAELAAARGLRVLNMLARRNDRSLAAARCTIAELDLRDPFDEALLRVAERAGRIVVYSVGPNLVDNGGREPHDVCLIPSPKYCEPN